MYGEVHSYTTCIGGCVYYDMQLSPIVHKLGQPKKREDTILF